MRITDLYPDVIAEDVNYEFKAVLNPDKPLKWAKCITQITYSTFEIKIDYSWFKP